MKRKLTMMLLCMMVAVTALAQSAINGTVVSAQDGEPIIGATVKVKGSAQGVVTNLEGQFSINAKAGTTLVFSYVGMQTKEAAAKNGMKVQLQNDDQVLDELVVTALGLTKGQKTIGYAATTLKAEELKSVPVTNVADALAGKVAGVSINTTQTGPGGAASIQIRSFSSITGSNEPLWIVDGVPMVNNSIDSGTSDNYIGAGATNINQDDIESMTILKGAAATALYGSRAANGVVLVTTKTGAKTGSKNFMIEASAGIQWSRVTNLPQMQDKYGQGWNGGRTLDENGSWGPEMDGKWRVFGAIWQQDNSQLMQRFQAVKDNVKNFFETGVQQNYNFSLSGNTDKTTYYLSYSNVSEDGIIPGDYDKYQRNTFGMRGSHQATNWLKLSSNVNIAIANTHTVPTDQGTTMIDGLYEMPRNMSIADMKDLSSPFNTPDAYFTEYGITNPYWALANNYSELAQKKIYGKLQADITPVKDVTLIYRFGFDYSDYDQKEGMAKITADNPSTSANNKKDGSVFARYYRRYELNHDFLGNYSHSFGDLDIDATIGVNINERYYTYLKAEGTNLTIHSGWWDLANAASSIPSETQQKRRIIGLLGDLQFGYKQQLFLDITGRNDWSSTLPKGNNSFFYPGITASWVFTETFKDVISKDIINYGKLRAAFGKTGNDAEPYYTNDIFESGYANTPYHSESIKFPMSNGTNSFKTGSTKGSPTLQPEMTTEWELGTELHLLDNRITIDASYYNRKTSDMIMRLSTDPASGYNYTMTNLGEVKNTGVELALNFTPIRTNDWQWDISVNWAKNNNEVVSLPESLGNEYTINRFETSADNITMKAIVGKPLGQLYGYETQYVDANNNLKYTVIDDKLQANPAFDASTGKILVGSNGIPTRTTDVVALNKSTQNKWSGGFGTTIKYKNFSLSANFDVRYGGYMFSRTKNLMMFTGNGIATIYNDRRAFIIPNSVTSDGNGGYTENMQYIDMFDNGIQSWYDAGGNESSNDLLVKKTYIKLRSLAVGYTLPHKWLNKLQIQDVRLSFVANNLFTWTPASNAYIDPDTSSYGSDLYGSFGELYSNPGCRKFGFNVNVKF